MQYACYACVQYVYLRLNNQCMRMHVYCTLPMQKCRMQPEVELYCVRSCSLLSIVSLDLLKKRHGEAERWRNTKSDKRCVVGVVADAIAGSIHVLQFLKGRKEANKG